DLVSVANPDEDFTEGPVVAFEVRPPAPRKFPLWVPVVAAALLVAAGVGIWLATRPKGPPPPPKAGAWGGGVPQPPLHTARHPLEPVTAKSGQEWAQRVLGVDAMELAGTFNVKGQYVDSINYLTVVQQVGFFGPKRAVNCVSYICVSGDGAWTVDVGFLNSD